MLSPDHRDLLSEFAAFGVEFLVVGAYALGAYARPRATGDIDFWIRRTPENAERTLRALAAFGAPVEEISVSELTTPDLVIQFGVEPNRIDILTSIDGVEFEAAWPRRTEVVIDGVGVPLLGLAELIANKRASGRPKDRQDLVVLLEVARRRGLSIDEAETPPG
jgi:predicted nucleotidyltransferase